jgi:hypothetical protein
MVVGYLLLASSKFIVTIQSVRVFNVRPYINNIDFIMGVNKVFQCLPYAKYFKGDFKYS